MFYSNLSKTVALSVGVLAMVFLIGYFVLAWTGPTQPPPGGNVPAPINVGGVSQTKLGALGVSGVFRAWGGAAGPSDGLTVSNGNVGIGTTTPRVGLEVYGAPGSQRITSIPSGTTGTYTLSWDSFQICQFGTCCSPWGDCDGDGRTYAARNDCHEGCSTCFVGSHNYTVTPDGADQDCDGIVDEDVEYYLLFDTDRLYSGNLGGRSGADSKCDGDTDKPANCVGSAWAFISVSAIDEVRDMPTTKGVDTSPTWSFQDGASPPSVAARNWADLLDGTVENTPITGGLGGPYWTGSSNHGTFHDQSCSNWTIADFHIHGIFGSPLTTNTWLGHSTAECWRHARLLCSCKAIGRQ